MSVFEHSLGFREILDMKSNTTVSAIKDIMMRMQVDFGKCCGECYDGASNMIISKQIKKIKPEAHYTHCHGHSEHSKGNSSAYKILP